MALPRRHLAYASRQQAFNYVTVHPDVAQFRIFDVNITMRGAVAAQTDIYPLNGIRPTSTWGPGEKLEDVVGIKLPEDLAPGTYVVAAGLYDPASFERVSALDANGDPFSRQCSDPHPVFS